MGIQTVLTSRLIGGCQVLNLICMVDLDPAATAVGIAASSIGPAGVYVDRPFVFAIRDKLTDSILFLGRVDDPRES